MKHDRYIYYVVGAVAFPVDMLRYDAAHPAGKADAHLIEASIRSHGDHDAILVEVIGDRLPTAGRWHSCGWRPVAGTVRGYRRVDGGPSTLIDAGQARKLAEIELGEFPRR